MSQGALRTRNHYILIASSEGKVSAMQLISVLRLIGPITRGKTRKANAIQY